MYQLPRTVIGAKIPYTLYEKKNYQKKYRHYPCRPGADEHVENIALGQGFLQVIEKPVELSFSTEPDPNMTFAIDTERLKGLLSETNASFQFAANGQLQGINTSFTDKTAETALGATKAALEIVKTTVIPGGAVPGLIGLLSSAMRPLAAAMPPAASPPECEGEIRYGEVKERVEFFGEYELNVPLLGPETLVQVASVSQGGGKSYRFDALRASALGHIYKETQSGQEGVTLASPSVFITLPAFDGAQNARQILQAAQKGGKKKIPGLLYRLPGYHALSITLEPATLAFKTSESGSGKGDGAQTSQGKMVVQRLANQQVVLYHGRHQFAQGGPIAYLPIKAYRFSDVTQSLQFSEEGFRTQQFSFTATSSGEKSMQHLQELNAQLHQSLEDVNAMLEAHLENPAAE